MFKGWFKVHRSLFDNDLWLAEPFTKGQAWVDLIGHANHKPASVWIRGIEVSVGRGQLAWSELTMAKRWQWSRGKVRRYLGMLEKRQMIEQQKDELTTVLTICNYELYQGSDTTDETASSTTDKTAGDTPDGQQTVHKQECKNGENDKGSDMHGPQQAESEPSVIDLPTNKHGTQGEVYGVSQSQVDLWQEDYPAVSVMSELHKARSWLDSNPSRRKTKQGMKRFLNNWLNKAQDRGGSPQLGGQQQRRQPKDFFG